jgi:hypothetical protein
MYESRARIEPGRRRGGGPVVQVPYHVIEGVMDSISTGSPQRQVCRIDSIS